MKKRKDLIREYVSDYEIQQMIDNGHLYRLSKAVYSEKKDVPELAVIIFQYPHAVVTLNTAFYIYGLTDAIPDIYDLATDRDAAKIRNPQVKQYFYPSDFFTQGVEAINYRDYPISIYSRERMLIELLRYKTKLPFDYYKEIILNYRKILPQLDIQKIQDYALEAPKSKAIMERLQSEVL